LEARDPSGLAHATGNADEFRDYMEWSDGLLNGGGGRGSDELIAWAASEHGILELLTAKVSFTGTASEIQQMERAWNHAVRAIADGGRRGYGDAAWVIGEIQTALSAGVSFEFQAVDFGPNDAGTGATNSGAGQTTMRIDLERIANPGYKTTIAATMVHEFGHAVYHTTGAAYFRYNSDASNYYALTFENAYRWSVHANLKYGHEDNTTPWRN
jgi:hypothetical protein